MAPAFLIVGATGNTGRGVVNTLSELVKSNTTFSDWEILAVTRSASGAAAQKLAQLPNVKIVEENWIDITEDWLRQHNVKRAFIASHNLPNQFAEESQFHVNALYAELEYVVRISTTASSVWPGNRIYYPRAHWAIEALLSTPEFDRLHWTSLQPNIFSQMYLASAADLIKHYRKTGKQETLRIMGAEDAPIGIIDPDDVGILAAHLLTTVDTDRHNKAKYVISGPEDVTGRQIVAMVEELIEARLENVSFKDISFAEAFATQSGQSKNLIATLRSGFEPMWSGKNNASTTSKEVLDLAAPKSTPAKVLKALLE